MAPTSPSTFTLIACSGEGLVFGGLVKGRWTLPVGIAVGRSRLMALLTEDLGIFDPVSAVSPLVVDFQIALDRATGHGSLLGVGLPHGPVIQPRGSRFP
jgi:hypothetical protein